MGSELDLTMDGVLSGECNTGRVKGTKRMRANACSDQNNGPLHLFRGKKGGNKG